MVSSFFIRKSLQVLQKACIKILALFTLAVDPGFNEYLKEPRNFVQYNVGLEA